MEERKEVGVSIWVWVAVIGVAAALVATFIIFLRPQNLMSRATFVSWPTVLRQSDA